MQPRNSLAAALGKSFEEEREKVVNFYRDINGDLSAVENITSSYRRADWQNEYCFSLMSVSWFNNFKSLLELWLVK